MLEVVKTSASVNPWRLKLGEFFVPHSACRLKRDAVALKTQLEHVADWSEFDSWPIETHQAVQDVLAKTDSMRIHQAGLAAAARYAETYHV